MSTRKVAILGGKRIPFARSWTNYMGVTMQELMTVAAEGLVKAYKLEGKRLGELATGSVLKHPADWNLAREVVLGTSLDPHTPAYDVSQACGTSLETAILVANKIALGQIESGIAGGCDTNSDVPFYYSHNFGLQMLEANKEKTLAGKLKHFMKIGLKDLKPHSPGVVEPRTGLSMGESCEKMVKTWKIPREAQDELAYLSHKNAAKAYAEGYHQQFLIPFKGLDKDMNVRADTTIEKLAKLKPVFDKTGKGTLTAGNSTPMTDGAGAVLLGSEEWAKQNGLKVLAYFVDGETAAVDYVKGGEGLLMAPAYAVPRLLKRNNMKLQDFDLYEIHEAFAGQVLCTLKAWEDAEFCKNKLGLSAPLGSIDRSKMNLKGGSLALGHPFGATGARIVASLAQQLTDRGGGRGLISICTGGGMGVTAILEK
jgi:acetyl-CoA C-acetyltransferase